MCDGYFLSHQQLRRLKEHKYKSEGTTFLDPLLQPFWNWLVEQIPLWVAPNLITFVGLLFLMFTGILLIYADPIFSADDVRFPFALFAIGLFVYSCLDAVDGKQARRTNSATPLGELFDHGCDSIACIFLVLATISAVQIGIFEWYIFWHVFLVVFSFYSYQWRTYVNGVLTFSKFDVTEIQYSVIATCCVRSVIGPGILHKEVMPGVPIVILMHYAISAIQLYILLRTLVPINYEGVGRNGTTEAGTSVLSPGIPVAILIVFAWLYARHSRISPLRRHPALFALAFSMPVAKYSMLLVLAHMSKSPLPLLDSIMLGPLFTLINIYFGHLLEETLALWLCLLYVCANTFYACVSICLDICNYLDIYCFKLREGKKNS